MVLAVSIVRTFSISVDRFAVFVPTRVGGVPEELTLKFIVDIIFVNKFSIALAAFTGTARVSTTGFSVLLPLFEGVKSFPDIMSSIILRILANISI